MMHSPVFCFDLDGTITNAELLPLIARRTDLEDEITALTRATIEGDIPFETSFRLRCRLLADVPISSVRDIAADVPLNEDMPILERLGCRAFSSTAVTVGDVLIGVDRALFKADAVEELRTEHPLVVAIGDGMNDVPMFEAADVAVAFGGVHPPAQAARDASDFVAMNGDGLCKLLTSL